MSYVELVVDVALIVLEIYLALTPKFGQVLVDVRIHLLLLNVMNVLHESIFIIFVERLSEHRLICLFAVEAFLQTDFTVLVLLQFFKHYFLNASFIDSQCRFGQILRLSYSSAFVLSLRLLLPVDRRRRNLRALMTGFGWFIGLDGSHPFACIHLRGCSDLFAEELLLFIGDLDRNL